MKYFMLTELQLTNFKCFENETIPLRPLTLLTGLNGMGKSSVLQALLLIKQNYDYKLAFSQLPWAINGNYIELGTVRDILYQYFTRKEIKITIVHNSRDLSLISRWHFDATDMDSDALTVTSRPTEAEYHPDFAIPWLFHYLNAERLGPRAFSQMSNQEVVNESQVGIHGELTAHYLAVWGNDPIKVPALRFPEEKISEPKYGLSLNEQIDAWLSVIRPGARVTATTNRDMGLVGLKYQFIAGSDRGNEFRPTNVGFGLSYVLPLLVAILTSPVGSLILLENPEAHLHPRGQAEIGKLLAMAASQGIQVIVETHSDHIMNGARVAVRDQIIKAQDCAFLFFTGALIEGKFQHYVENVEITNSGKLSYRPEGFFDEWDNLLMKLL